MRFFLFFATGFLLVCGGQTLSVDKLKDLEECEKNTQCSSGVCELVAYQTSFCKPENGFAKDFPCNEDTDCDQTKKLSCGEKSSGKLKRSYTYKYGPYSFIIYIQC